MVLALEALLIGQQVAEHLLRFLVIALLRCGQCDAPAGAQDVVMVVTEDPPLVVKHVMKLLRSFRVVALPATSEREIVPGLQGARVIAA